MDEFEKLRAKGTYKVVHGYNGHKVPLKWVFTYKTVPTAGEVTRLKARLCVRGDLQLPSTHETYAATLGYKVFRAITAFAYAKNLQIRQWGVVNAFPNAVIPHTVYYSLPEGIDQLGLGNNASRLLQKALYGLAESPRLWYDLFVIRMEDYGFEMAPGILRCFDALQKMFDSSKSPAHVYGVGAVPKLRGRPRLEAVGLVGNTCIGAGLVDVLDRNGHGLLDGFFVADVSLEAVEVWAGCRCQIIRS